MDLFMLCTSENPSIPNLKKSDHKFEFWPANLLFYPTVPLPPLNPSYKIISLSVFGSKNQPFTPPPPARHFGKRETIRGFLLNDEKTEGNPEKTKTALLMPVNDFLCVFRCLIKRLHTLLRKIVETVTRQYSKEITCRG